MQICKASVVRSAAGRDTGSLFLVMDVLENGYAYIIDGKIRRIEKPKKKKLKHLAFIAQDSSKTAGKILNAEKLTNAEIRRLLAAYAPEAADPVNNGR